MILSFFLLDPIHMTAGTGQYHDGEWHSLLIKRYGSKVTLKVDQQYVIFLIYVTCLLKTTLSPKGSKGRLQSQNIPIISEAQ